MQIEQHTTAYWTSENPILAKNFAGVETETLRIKYGNAVTEWLDLPYSGFKLVDNHLVAEQLQEIELVSGIIDGVNDTFVWDYPPELVYLNGQLLKDGEGYVLTGSTTVFATPPFAGADPDIIWTYGNY